MAMMIEVTAATRTGIEVASTEWPTKYLGMAQPMTTRPATIQPAVPSTRMEPKSFLVSFIWRKATALLSAIVGM
jgi:hypothetical protein